MLVQFSVTNYKTFKDKAVLSMVASNYDKKSHEETHVVKNEKFKLRLLKTAVVYGANASGKTKLLEALGFMVKLVKKGMFNGRPGSALQTDPFRLNSETQNAPSVFEVIFLFHDVLYRYGFSITQSTIVEEWLYLREAKKEIEVFYRKQLDFEVHHKLFVIGRKLVKDNMVKERIFLLSAAEKYNDELANKVMQGLNTFHLLHALEDQAYRGFTMAQLDENKAKNRIIELLKSADLSIVDLKAKKMDGSNFPQHMPEPIREAILEDLSEGEEVYYDLTTTRTVFDDNEKAVGSVQFSMEDDESAGTYKFFALLGPFTDILENGHTVLVDELDAKLHPNLVEAIVRLFNAPLSNPNNAQLIFNTHNSNLLQPILLRRDQIWFTEKDKFGAASLYSLFDIDDKQIRRNEAYEDNYLVGNYGAVPKLNFLTPAVASSILFEHEE